MSLTHAPDSSRQDSLETREQTAAPPLSNTEVIPTLYVHSDTKKLSAPPVRRPTMRPASRTRFRRRWKRNRLRRSQRREVHRSHATVVTFSLSITMPIMLLIVII